MAQPGFSLSNNPNPAEYALNCTDATTTTFANPCRGIYIGGAGTLVVTTLDNTTITFAGAVAGTVIPVRAKSVVSSSTATGLVALF